MNITRVATESESTLYLEGRLDQDSAPMLENAVRAAAEENEKIILNCRGLSGVSASGLRMLAIVQIFMRDHGGSLAICSCIPTVLNFFKNTGFHHVLTIR